jgi:predicted small secreted protein
MRNKVSVAVALLLLGLAAPLLSACYTASGAGQDLRAAGKTLENSADRNTTYKP